MDILTFKQFYYLTERRQKVSKEGGEVVFHGTTDKFLKSILSNGLNSGKERVWADDPDTTEYKQSRASYGGTYVTNNLLTAIQSGRNAVNKLGGDRIVIVCAKVQSRSGLPDEDNFYTAVNYSADYAIGGRNKLVGNHFTTVTNALVNYYENEKEFEEDVNTFIKRFKEWVDDYFPKQHSNISQLHEKLKKLYVAELLRRGFYHINSNKTYDLGKYKDEMLKLDKTEVENNFAKTLDTVMTTLKAQVYKQDDFNKTYRIKEPINYKGKNKIIAVIVLDNYMYGQKETDDAYILKVVYGEVPEKMIKEFRERIGANIKIVKGKL